MAATKFAVVHDRTGEKKKVTLEEFETRARAEGFRVLDLSGHAAAVVETRPTPPEPVLDPAALKMQQQTSADASAFSMLEDDKSDDAKTAQKLMKETDFEGRQEAVRQAEVAVPDPVAVRNARRAARNPIGVVQQDARRVDEGAPREEATTASNMVAPAGPQEQLAGPTPATTEPKGPAGATGPKGG